MKKTTDSTLNLCNFFLLGCNNEAITQFMTKVHYRNEAQRLIKLENDPDEQARLRLLIDNLNVLIKEDVYEIIDEL